MPIERIVAFVRGESDESFEELALAVFRRDYERSGRFRDLCDRRGATPATVRDWREVPATPAPEAAGPLGSEGPAADDPALVELRRAVVDGSFVPACLAGLGRPPVLSLLPAGPVAADPGPDLLAEHVLAARAAADSLVAAGRRGVEVARARSFLAARQRDRRPTLVLGTATTVAGLLAALARRGLRFRLPPGSRVVAAGGGEPAVGDLLARLEDGLAVPPEAVVHAWGAPGLVTRFCAGHGRRGEPRPFRPPPWTRVRILDPETRAEQPAGVTGPIAVFDLAGAGAGVHLLTGDLGVAGDGGFRLA